MCVQTQGHNWERPAMPGDIPIITANFPGIDFARLLFDIKSNGFRPLTTDLVLIGAMLTTPPDDCGIQSVPFAGLDATKNVIVKIPEMSDIVPWFEQTALATDMWTKTSDLLQMKYGRRIHFVMNGSCGLVPIKAYANGRWEYWLLRFNKSRAAIYGRTNIEYRNDPRGTDITPPQFAMWKKIVRILSMLPKISEAELTGFA